MKVTKRYTTIPGLLWWLCGKESICNARDTGDTGWIPVSNRDTGDTGWVGKIL